MTTAPGGWRPEDPAGRVLPAGGFGPGAAPAGRQRTVSPDRVLAGAAAATVGVSAGVFADFSFIVMPGVRELPPGPGIAAMQALNRAAPARFSLLALATTLVCAVLVVRAVIRWNRAWSPWIIASAAVYVFAAVVVTAVGNVPVSASIDALDPASPAAPARWDELFTQWVWWNHLRVLASAAAAAGFVTALRKSPGRPG